MAGPRPDCENVYSCALQLGHRPSLPHSAKLAPNYFKTQAHRLSYLRGCCGIQLELRMYTLITSMFQVITRSPERAIGLRQNTNFLA